VFRRPLYMDWSLEHRAPTVSFVLQGITLAATDIIILGDVLPLGRFLSKENWSVVPQDDGYKKRKLEVSVWVWEDYIQNESSTQKKTRSILVKIVSDLWT
jgi:hypothetical protein